jgi:hypothetical protein
MTLATPKQLIGSSSAPLVAHGDQARSSSDHWQVSQYFPLHPVRSAARWSRASGPSEQPVTVLNAVRGAGEASGEAPRERSGRPFAPRATSPHHPGRSWRGAPDKMRRRTSATGLPRVTESGYAVT